MIFDSKQKLPTVNTVHMREPNREGVWKIRGPSNRHESNVLSAVEIIYLNNQIVKLLLVH